MKKILLPIAFLLSVLGFSQPITVSATNFTVPELVNNVLINTPCIAANNITWSTGTNYGSSNGIGFFQNTNPNFPMQSGVILSTGNVLNAVGPNPNSSLLSDGTPNWLGDISLENILATAGINMVSKNATLLEFDFTPVSSNFSFDFLFASEEYGNFQCNFSDAFAFLLTNTSTGVTTNLAVVPNTNLPISVVTIRDNQYNSSCGASNPQFFGMFNGGSNASNSATNFNGQTKLLTAGSSLTPGITYHIKLVIADRADYKYDSAIFIASDSFNIGQDVLGQDLTIANNKAICFGSTYTLNTGLSASNYTFIWKRNGVTLAGQTGPSLSINQPGNYSVSYNNISNLCQPVTDLITVDYYPQIISPNPKSIYACDNGGSTFNFDLNLNTNRVKQGLDPLTIVNYYSSQSDADTNINQLPLLYNAPSGQIVFVRIQIPNSLCYIVKSFQLLKSPAPVAYQPQDLITCARSQTQNDAYCNFNQQTLAVLNGQSSTTNIVSYYTSLNDANDGINPIINTTNGLFTDTTIYVKVQNSGDSTCFSITSFNIIINPLPVVDELEDVLVCDNYTLQPLQNGNYFTSANGNGLPLFAGDVIIQTQTIYIFNQPGGPGTCGANSSFKVTIIDKDSLAPKNVTNCGEYTLPFITYGNYYSAPGGNGIIIPAGTIISSTQTIYYYFISPDPPFCTVDTNFIVTILPSVEVGNRADVFECNSYTLPPLTLGDYYSGPNGTGNLLSAGTNITTSQTLYVYVAKTNSPSCIDQDIFEVFIGINQPQNITQCNGYTLPALPIGNYYTGPMGTGQQISTGTVINQSCTLYIYSPTTSGGPNCSDNLFFTLTITQPKVDIMNNISACVNYTLPPLTNGEYYTGINGTGTMLHNGDVILSTQTIYIFKRLDSSCFNQSSFTVTINALPNIDSRSDIDICDEYVLTPLNVGNYYTGPNGTGTLLPASSIITSSQKIYIYAISNMTPSCSIENSFQINIFSTSADGLPNITACDNYTLPSLTLNNKFYTKSGGPNGSGIELLPGTIITSSQTIYIFKESLIRATFSCLDETSFTITINNTPIIQAVFNVAACNSFKLLPLIIGDYYTGPNGSGNILHSGDVLTTSQTIYIYAHSLTSPDCSSQISFALTIFNVDNLPNITICENYTLPSLTIGQYYTGPNGTGTKLIAGASISTSQTIYIYAVSPYLPRCSDESSFTVTIIDTPIANTVPMTLRTICDEDEKNDGLFLFNLSNLTSTILGTQTGSEFTIAYYESLLNASNQTNAVTSTKLTTVYVRVNNTLAPSCYDIKPTTITVNKLPEPNPVDGIICIDKETGTLLNPYTIYSGLSTSSNYFVWTNEANVVVGNGNSYQANLPGVYTLVTTSNVNGCISNPVSVTINPSEPAIISYTIGDEFANTQSITVLATGQGNNFEYQLDNGYFQDNPVFENVTSGIHLITVRDKNGCGSTTARAIVVNYPKFFTPNSDGYNDTWNIKDLSGQPNASILIYDRYGKFLKQIKPSESGWDGNYNGNMMPSDDYWFSVTYKDENQVDQEFKAHFAMKR